MVCVEDFNSMGGFVRNRVFGFCFLEKEEELEVKRGWDLFLGFELYFFCIICFWNELIFGFFGEGMWLSVFDLVF